MQAQTVEVYTVGSRQNKVLQVKRDNSSNSETKKNPNR